MAEIFFNFFALVSTSQLTYVLIAVAVVFLVFILRAVIKTYRLNAENKKLTEMDNLKSEEDKNYKDFTEGHLYDNNK